MINTSQALEQSPDEPSLVKLKNDLTEAGGLVGAPQDSLAKDRGSLLKGSSQEM